MDFSFHFPPEIQIDADRKRDARKVVNMKKQEADMRKALDRAKRVQRNFAEFSRND